VLDLPCDGRAQFVTNDLAQVLIRIDENKAAGFLREPEVKAFA
jgi:hypothetical protein